MGKGQQKGRKRERQKLERYMHGVGGGRGRKKVVVATAAFGGRFRFPLVAVLEDTGCSAGRLFFFCSNKNQYSLHCIPSSFWNPVVLLFCFVALFCVEKRAKASEFVLHAAWTH